MESFVKNSQTLDITYFFKNLRSLYGYKSTNYMKSYYHGILRPSKFKIDFNIKYTFTR